MTRLLLPLAAALVLLLVGRSVAPVVAWMIVEDHENCHVVERLDGPPASLPAEAAGLVLLGASVCQLRDRGLVVHAQYGADDERRVSVFLVDRAVLLGSGYASTVAGHAVRLSRRDGRVVGVVADRAEDADAFGRAWGPPRTAQRSRILRAALP